MGRRGRPGKYECVTWRPYAGTRFRDCANRSRCVNMLKLVQWKYHYMSIRECLTDLLIKFAQNRPVNHGNYAAPLSLFSFLVLVWLWYLWSAFQIFSVHALSFTGCSSCSCRSLTCMNSRWTWAQVCLHTAQPLLLGMRSYTISPEQFFERSGSIARSNINNSLESSTVVFFQLGCAGLCMCAYLFFESDNLMEFVWFIAQSQLLYSFFVAGLLNRLQPIRTR
jgi:hypothetical protein